MVVLGGVAITALTTLTLTQNSSLGPLGFTIDEFLSGAIFLLGLFVAAGGALEGSVGWGERWRHFRLRSELLRGGSPMPLPREPRAGRPRQARPTLFPHSWARDPRTAIDVVSTTRVLSQIGAFRSIDGCENREAPPYFRRFRGAGGSARSARRGWPPARGKRLRIRANSDHSCGSHSASRAQPGSGRQWHGFLGDEQNVEPV